MADPFDSLDDTALYLNNSVCMLEDEPVYVSVVDRNVARLQFLTPELAGKTIRTTAPEFHWSNMQLGYCNLDNKAVFLRRLPDRRQKVGITSANLQVSTPDGARMEFPLISTNLRDVLQNRYPSFDEALAFTLSKKQKNCGRAFHRLFCLQRMERGMIGLYFRERLVAVRIKDTFQLLTGEDISLIYRLLAPFPIDLREKRGDTT